MHFWRMKNTYLKQEKKNRNNTSEESARRKHQKGH